MVGLSNSRLAPPIQCLLPSNIPRVAHEPVQSQNGEQASQDSLNKETVSKEQPPLAENGSPSKSVERESTSSESKSPPEESRIEPTAQEKENAPLPSAEAFSSDKDKEDNSIPKESSSQAKPLPLVSTMSVEPASLPSHPPTGSSSDMETISTSENEGHSHIGESSQQDDRPNQPPSHMAKASEEVPNEDDDHREEGILSQLFREVVGDILNGVMQSSDSLRSSEEPVPLTYGEWVEVYTPNFYEREPLDAQENLDMNVTEYMEYLGRFHPVFLSTFSSYIEDVHASEIEDFLDPPLPSFILDSFEEWREEERESYIDENPALDDYELFRMMQKTSRKTSVMVLILVVTISSS